ncbi:ACT domain-containing protein [Clostridium sp. AM58-1XD]|uniref:ACT domain-containing protein n=1 Tax=Clostridium sp. AM58-1XD TaxID=2292307 RepID=UPI000E479259|nr:ACT domain-containing protein [Clostridium sp. AM58-1XD]RGZ01584.1 ACT domain-containing protein [Clostridium sp. AM58-1XD]
MVMKRLDYEFTVCKVPDLTGIDLDDEFYFIGKTDEELSLVCRTERVPQLTTAREDGWKAMRIEGVLDFSLIGILAKISAVLADHKIGIFVVSTFHTDYILTKTDDFERAAEVLGSNGYTIAD